MGAAAQDRFDWTRRWPSAGGLLLLAGSLALAGRTASSADQTAAAAPALLPAGKGAELTQKLCTTCHTVESFNGLRRSASAWEDTVAVMVAYGAPIDQPQTAAVVQYLGQVFGPDSPPLVEANRARRDDLEKLPGLDAASIEALLTHRTRHGGFKSLEQIQEIIGAAKFERLKGYLMVRKPSGR